MPHTTTVQTGNPTDLKYRNLSNDTTVDLLLPDRSGPKKAAKKRVIFSTPAGVPVTKVGPTFLQQHLTSIPIKDSHVL